MHNYHFLCILPTPPPPSGGSPPLSGEAFLSLLIRNAYLLVLIQHISSGIVNFIGMYDGSGAAHDIEKPLVCPWPINNIEPILNIGGALVIVLEIIRMLPYIYIDYR